MRLVVAAAALVIPGPAVAQVTPVPLDRGETLLEVVGEGVQRSRPDVMTISAGVVSTGQTAGSALQANSALLTRVIEAVRRLGLEPRDVRTRELRVSPRIDRQEAERADREDRPPRILGYVARNTLELRLRELARGPELIDALISAGANDVAGPRFSLADEAEAKRAARRNAVADARAEAEEYAAAAGLRVARVLRMSERSRSGGFNGQEEGIMITGSRIAGAPIEPGEIETDVTVWVDYALVPK